MCASEVLTDHHMLNSLTRTSHVHTVWKIFPSGAVVVSLLLKDLVGLVTNSSGDVVSLSRPAGGVHKDNASSTNERIIQGTSEKLVVSPVHRVSALECYHVNITVVIFLTPLSSNSEIKRIDRPTFLLLAPY